MGEPLSGGTPASRPTRPSCGATSRLRPIGAGRQVTVWPLSEVPALAPSAAPVGFASGKGKVKEPDEQGSRPSKAPQAPQT